MTTTIHISSELLSLLDHKVKGLRISRNKYICMILQKELSTVWPEEFVHKKLVANKLLIESVGQMQKLICDQRVNKKGVSW